MKKDIKDLTNEELDQEFINYFGKEELERQKALGILTNFSIYICDKYLKVTPPPIVFDNSINTDAKYDIKLDAIIININLSNDFYTALRGTIHELRHYYQINYINQNNDEQALRWKKEFENYKDESNLSEYLNQEIELDAYAFTQVVVKNELQGELEVDDALAQEKINEIKLNYKF